MDFSTSKGGYLASKGITLHTSRLGDIRIVLQCDSWELINQIRSIPIRTEAKSITTEENREAQKGDKKMANIGGRKYQFRFKGGAKKLDKANYKFHIFVVGPDATEHHLYGALKNGLAEKEGGDSGVYHSIAPVLKVFTATAGFGIPKEYFSYFVILSPDVDRIITIKPLGFEKLGSAWSFAGQGRFLKRDEIRNYFGSDSDTWKFYNRQSFLSRQRLQQLVTVTSVENFLKPDPLKKVTPVRMVRLD